MDNAHGILMAYENRHELTELTKFRTVSSVPFGSKYRLIDFALSSLENAGISNVGIVVRQSYRSLSDHLGNGRDWDMSRKNGGLTLLPPNCFSGSTNTVINGKLDALVGVQDYINSIPEKYVVLMEGDMVYNIDINAVLQEHINSNADITVVCVKDDVCEGKGLYYELDENNDAQVVRIEGHTDNSYCGIKISVYSTELLKSIVQNAKELGYSDIRRDVIQRNVGKLKIHAYIHDGYVASFNTLDDYLKRNMDLLKPEVRKELFRKERPILTKVRDETSTYYGPDSNVSNSIVADGCYFEGTVKNSILFRGVHIGKGAVVENCVLMHNVQVGENVVLKNVVADKNVNITAGKTLQGNDSYPFALAKGVTI